MYRGTSGCESRRHGARTGGRRARTMRCVCISKGENGFFKVGDFVVHFVGFEMRLELEKVIDSPFSVRRRDDMRCVLLNVVCDFCPSCFNGLDAVSQRAVLMSISSGSTRAISNKARTMSNRTASA